MRLFAAIPLPENIHGDVERIQKSVSGARWVSAEKLHVTLGFFDEVTDDFAEVLDRELGRMPRAPFDLKLSGVGHYGSYPARSLWAGVLTANSPNGAVHPSDPLLALHTYVKKCARRADIIMEHRAFHPHVTLAYLSPHTDLERVLAFEKAQVRYATVPFLVDRFQLLSSIPHRTGPNTYRIEAEYPLDAPEVLK